ncbi:MAG: hypothetical protein IPP51_16330 [Bacteroidetes bacterium]|nr:hypothetical protein [Bacteroidota bacterium]
MLSSPTQFLWFLAVATLTIVLMMAFFFYVLVKNVRVRQKSEVDIRDAVISTQEAEQNRIAEDLHDELGPMLSAVKLKVSTLADLEKDELGQSVELVEDYLDRAISDIRLVARNLSSHLIAKYGLEQSLRENINLISKSKSISIQMDFKLNNILLTEEVQTNLYRILRELLNNSVKHSNCTDIDISIVGSSDFIDVKFDDNGNAVKREAGKGLGQTSVRNRLNLLRATVVKFTDEFSLGSHYHFILPVKNS